jgi:hypothetical protein
VARGYLSERGDYRFVSDDLDELHDRRKRVAKLIRRIGSMIVTAAVRGAGVRYGIDPVENYSERRVNETSVTRAQAERWRY